MSHDEVLLEKVISVLCEGRFVNLSKTFGKIIGGNVKS